MTTQNLGLFQALHAKMSYLDERQKILSRNIANANTPDYKPHDLTELKFDSVLKKVTGSTAVVPQTTNPNHMPSPTHLDEAKNQAMKKTYDVVPTGNAVIMEEQMVNSTQTAMDFNLMTTLYQKQVGMIRIALGAGR